MRNVTASDRSALIKLASSLPAGSPERKAILASLGKTANHSSTLADSLKKKWENVTYDLEKNQGKASVGDLEITFYEGVSSVIITIKETHMKADAETAEKILNAINAAFRMA